MEAKKLRQHWEKEDEQLFIKLWRENYTRLRGFKRNGQIHKELSEKMREAGFDISAPVVQSKIHNMTTKYKQERRKTDWTGRRSRWVWYNDLDAVLGVPYKTNSDASVEILDEQTMDESNTDTKEFYADLLMQSGESESKETEEDTSANATPIGSASSNAAENKPSPETQTTSTRRILLSSSLNHNVIDRILSSLDHLDNSNTILNEQNDEVTKELLSLERKNVALLETYVKKTCEVHDAFLE